MKFPATHKYLEMFKAAQDGASDYRVAQLLDVTRSTVSNWRNDRKGMSDETGMMIANRLDLDVVEVISELNKDRAQTNEMRQYYDDLIARIKTPAAIVFSCAIGFLIGMEPSAFLI